MRPATATFLQMVRGSHRMDARARVVSGHPTGVNPSGVEIPILGGDVNLDANAEIRSTLDLTTDGTNMWPASSSDLLTPYGNEVFVERGIVFGDGHTEWISQGYFRLDGVNQARVPNGNIRIAGKDRMAGLIDSRLTAPIQFAAGSSVELVFESLVGEVYPTATIVFDFNAATTLFTTSHVAEDNRFGFLLDVARSHGKIMFWDHEGQLRVESAPDPADPVFEINAGRDGVLVSMSRSLSRQGVFNAVVATGEAPGQGDPVRAVVLDLNPSSPTYWYGEFGKVPRFYSSSFITTTAQAFDAAEAMLRRELGLPYNVDFTAVPNPALEPLDPVRINGAGSPELHVLEKLKIPLVASGAMSATTREQTLITIGAG